MFIAFIAACASAGEDISTKPNPRLRPVSRSWTTFASTIALESTDPVTGALLSIHAMKGVEIGLGFEAARRPGSRAHDPILPAALTHVSDQEPN